MDELITKLKAWLPGSGSKPVPRVNVCQKHLDAYVKCMETNRGRAPDPYETEYCASERNLYKLCREEAVESQQ